MPGIVRTFAAAFLLFFSVSTARSTELSEGRVRGVVSDASGAVLPGVTVVALSTDGRSIGTTVTNDVGSYQFDALPAGMVGLTFELEGFTTAAVQVTVEPGLDSSVSPRLILAPLAETVVVHGEARAVPRLPPPTPLPPPPPTPVVLPVPEHDRDSICGPAKANAILESFGTIRERRDTRGHGLYA